MSAMILIEHPQWHEVKEFTPSRAAWVLSKGKDYKVVQPKFKLKEEGQTNAENDNGNKSDSPRPEKTGGDSEGRSGRGKGKASQ